ncbi:Autophagy-related protein 23 [[Candida] zeylanoides]
MSSPARLEPDYSYVEGEMLSPIKLPATNAIVHPHGLTAKYEARRQTIHHTTMETPKSDTRATGAPFSSLKPLLAPLTSPRAAAGSTRADLASLRKSKHRIDAKLVNLQYSSPSHNKENLFHHKSDQLVSDRNLPLESSPNKMMDSPLNVRKRHDSEHARPAKIAKVVTNANDLESSFKRGSIGSDDDGANLSIQVDEVFHKEDLVGQLSNVERLQTVIDNDSDSDLAAVVQTDVSQTIATQHNKSREATQSHTIISGANVDYVTPKRPTEPVAKSPETGQQIRMVEAVEVENTTPLKKHQPQPQLQLPLESEQPYEQKSPRDRESSEKGPTVDDNEDIYDDFASDDEEEMEEDEATTDFLSSPNSKPVFSISHIKKIQDENAKEIGSLENVIYHKNQEILKFSEELSSTNGKFLILDQEIKELTSAKKKSLVNEELLRVQLNHTEADLAKTAKKLRLKTKLSIRLGEKTTKLRAHSKALQKELATIKEELSCLRAIHDMLQVELEQKKSLVTAQEDRLNTLEVQTQTLEGRLMELTDCNVANNNKIEQLLKEKEDLLTDLSEIKQEKSELQEINEKQTKLLEELDKLETLAKQKITDLESKLERSNEEATTLSREKQDVYEQLEKLTQYNEELEKSTKHELDVLRQKLKAKELEREHLQSKLDDSESRIVKLQSKLSELEGERSHLSQELTNTAEQVVLLKSTNKEKDGIISGDTKKMSELVETVNQLKQRISDREKEMSDRPAAFNPAEPLRPDGLVADLEAQVKALKDELEQSSAKSQARIQEVAESLYYQYSKKHESKVNEVRRSIEKKFKKQIDHLQYENKAQSRDIESLEKKLDIVTTEKNQLLGLIEEYKAVAEQDTRKQRSPRKTARSRY